MKRSTVFSTLMAIGLSALMAGWFVSAVTAHQASSPRKTLPCLNGCRTGETPQANGCCKAPGCEFFYAFKTAKAYELLAGNFELMKALHATFHNTVKEGTEFNLFVEDAVKAVAKKFTGCGSKTPYQPERKFEVDKTSCHIGFTAAGGFVEVPLDTEIANSAACEERVRADYKRAESLQAWCRARQREPDFPVTSREQQMEIAKSEKAKADSLRASFDQFLESCKNTTGADVAQYVLKLALADFEQATKPPKKKANRSGGGGR